MLYPFWGWGFGFTRKIWILDFRKKFQRSFGSLEVGGPKTFIILLIYNIAHGYQLTQKTLLYLALLVSCACITYLYVASLIPLYYSTPAWQAYTLVMGLFVLGILKLFSTFKI